MFKIYATYDSGEKFAWLNQFPSQEDARSFLHERQQMLYQERCKLAGETPQDNPAKAVYLTENYAVICDEDGNTWGVNYKGELWEDLNHGGTA